jgi:hypothetical protein
VAPSLSSTGIAAPGCPHSISKTAKLKPREVPPLAGGHQQCRDVAICALLLQSSRASFLCPCPGVLPTERVPFNAPPSPAARSSPCRQTPGLRRARRGSFPEPPVRCAVRGAGRGGQDGECGPGPRGAPDSPPRSPAAVRGCSRGSCGATSSVSPAPPPTGAPLPVSPSPSVRLSPSLPVSASLPLPGLSVPISPCVCLSVPISPSLSPVPLSPIPPPPAVPRLPGFAAVSWRANNLAAQLLPPPAPARGQRAGEGAGRGGGEGGCVHLPVGGGSRGPRSS